MINESAIILSLLVSVYALLHVSKKHGSYLVSIVIIALTLASGALSILNISTFMGIAISLSFAWALISNLRLFSQRRNYQLNIDLIISSWLTFILLYLTLSLLDFILVDSVLVSLLSIISLVVAIICLLSTIIHSFTYRLRTSELLDELHSPSVTMAIPARNETHAIELTLDSAIKSDYPKLEIIVVDDCSQDRTPQMIRDYAQKGIRFIEGKVLQENWLGKNASYKTLLEEASGEYVLFSGVDVHMDEMSISKLVATAVEGGYDMISVMPQRIGFNFVASFLQTTRYFFQFMLPWEIIPGVPVLSSAWLVKREKLVELGGFDVVPGMVVPERHFAKSFAKYKKYKFIVSDAYVGITSKKRTSSQLETATRTLYPLTKKNPLLVYLSSLTLLVFMVLPFVVSLMMILGYDYEAYRYALASTIIFSITNVLIYTRFNSSTWFIGLLNFPFIIVLEAILLQWSMIKYEYGKVVWKDRNICIPVLNPPLRRQRGNFSAS